MPGNVATKLISEFCERHGINHGGSKLSLKPIPVEKKIEVVSRTIAGEKIQAIAREVGFIDLLYTSGGKRY